MDGLSGEHILAPSWESPSAPDLLAPSDHTAYLALCVHWSFGGCPSPSATGENDDHASVDPAGVEVGTRALSCLRVDGVLLLGWSDWDRELSDIMTRYWVNFARSGDPNGEGLPPWPLYRAADDTVLEFGEAVVATAHPRRRQLDIFDAALPPPSGVR